MKRYLTFGVTFDTQGRTQGDVDDFERALDALEVDFPGTQLLGNDWTDRWPTFVVQDTPTSLPASTQEAT